MPASQELPAACSAEAVGSKAGTRVEDMSFTLVHFGYVDSYQLDWYCAVGRDAVTMRVRQSPFRPWRYAFGMAMCFGQLYCYCWCARVVLVLQKAMQCDVTLTRAMHKHGEM